MPELIELLESHGRTLHRLLLRITLRADVSEDLMQELFLKLSASQSFCSTDRPLAYAHRAAINLAFDWRRNQRRVRCVPIAECNPSDDLPSPLDCLIEREQVQKVLDAVARLPPRNRELLTLHYIQQESYKQLAIEYGKTPHQVRALCHKALAQLREYVSTSAGESGSGGET